MDPVEKQNLRKLLSELDIESKKKLGQHFLISKKIRNEILKLADLKKKDQVVELGAGLGALTLPLSKKVKRVYAIEKDSKIVEFLKRTYRSKPTVRVIKMDMRDLFVSEGPKKRLKFGNQLEEYKVVSNLPYYIASEVLRGFLEVNLRTKLAVVTLQKELVEKICSNPGEMDLISAQLQTFYELKKGAKVGREGFYPQPEVDSQILRLKKKNPGVNQRAFLKVVEAAFSHKRKTLLNSLALSFGEKQKTAAVLRGIGVGSYARPEDLSPSQWIEISTGLNRKLDVI